MDHVKPIVCCATLLVVASAVHAAPDLRSHGTSPRVSPDGKTIAFVGERGQGPRVFTIGSSGGRERAISPEGENAGSGQWMRDGRLAFTAFANDTSRLIALSSRGTRDTIATVPGRNPIPLPDGRVLFSTGGWRTMQVSVARRDGSGARQVSDGAGAIWAPTVSRDGARVAFGRSTDEGLNVWVMNVDGTGARAITHLADAEGHAQMPAWSADGKRLAIQVSGKRGDRTAPEFDQVWIVDLESGKTTKLTPEDAAYRDEVPCWFPDGSRLAFQSDRSGRMEIWVMNADGSKPRQVTR